jgi:hypothetical protein
MSLTAAPTSTNIPNPKNAVDTLLSEDEVPENAPPTYKEAVSELVTNLQKKMAENPDALHAEFAKAFRSNEVDQIFQQRMNQLVESATIINKGFESVATATLTFDLKKYKKSDGTAIRAFAPDWKILKDVRGLAYPEFITSNCFISEIYQSDVGVSYIRYHYQEACRRYGCSNYTTNLGLQ